MVIKRVLLVTFIAFLGFCGVYFIAPSRTVEPEVAVAAVHGDGAELDGALRAEVDEYIAAQWQKHGDAWVPKDPRSLSRKRTECIVFYAHGYMGPIQGTSEYSDYLFCPLESALRSFRYRVCNPGFDGRKKYMSFAQGFDAYQVKQHLKRLLWDRDTFCPDVHVICIAHSNGAATLISVLCNNPDLANRVDGVVLLAPYADISEAVALRHIPGFLGGKSTAQKFLKYFLASKYDTQVSSPLKCVEEGKYVQNLPTLLVHSRDDIVVPYNNFEMLQKAFMAKNDNVQFLPLEHDTHFFMHPSPELKGAMRTFIDGVLGRPVRTLSAESM